MLIEPEATTLPLSFSAGPQDVALLQQTIGEGLRCAVERFGDREALVVRDQGYRATYDELWHEVGLAARGLLARGVRTGDRVGIWAPNRYEWLVIQYATARIGAILVTINPAYKPAELEYALTKTGVSVLVLARGFRQADYVAMVAQVRSRCPLLRETVGMTETAPLSTQTAIDDDVEKRVTTVGRVHPHVEIKIVDPETGATVPRGTAGEQCTRGYSVMLGYWPAHPDDEQATARAIDADGWMHSGDLATMDDEGYLKIVGRIKDMLIRGGENIYPREVEEFLLTIPEVSDAYVIGVPSAHYGEEVMAWVKLRAGSILSPEALTAACRGKIATYKIPRYWKLVDEFPMTITGKVQKFVMREIATAELAAV
jgi:acyl-CoA synthetase (AMP-forming)/AMP-acid ligase II